MLLRAAFITLVLLFAGCDTSSQSAAATPQAVSVSAQAMSIGQKLVTVDQGHMADASDPRIKEIEDLIAAVADRYRLDAERVADMAIVTARKIREGGHQEILEDVLDAPLTATVGDEGPYPELSSVLAIYAASRLSGSPPSTAKRVTYAFLHVNIEK